MPINILNYTGKADGEKPERLDWLCGDKWELPAKIEYLQKWLETTGKKFTPGAYVADVGFSPREGACGGGGVISHESIAIMAAIGMNLFLSEYPAMEEDSE